MIARKKNQLRKAKEFNSDFSKVQRVVMLSTTKEHATAAINYVGLFEMKHNHKLLTINKILKRRIEDA